MIKRDILGRYIKGSTSSFKGKTQSFEAREKLSLAHKGKQLSEEHKAKIRASCVGINTGKVRSEATRLKISLAKNGQVSPNKGRVFSDEWRKRLSKSHIGYKPTEEQIKKVLRRREMSSLEISFNKIINENKLPYKFVGNGEILIGRKNPDFVNVNGRKIAIEVFYTKHKIKFRETDIDTWKNERAKIFNQYGWTLLFFNETQVNNDDVLRELGSAELLYDLTNKKELQVGRECD